MDLRAFVNDDMGELVEIRGTDPHLGDWEHKAFVPAPLTASMPRLDVASFMAIADARAALAALDSTARQLPNPTLLRNPSLRKEAQSTSALEGTYAPLAEVLTADEEDPATPELTEILNYVRMANDGYDWVGMGRPITRQYICHLQGELMKGTELQANSGALREIQVVIGQRAENGGMRFPVERARFVPAPPNDQLSAGVDDLLHWIETDHSGSIDPVVAAAMSHYQFETLHPFQDGNGRIGRFLIVIHLLRMQTISEPTLTVSPWFEARRGAYYDALLGVSTRGDWDTYIQFFAQGIKEAATHTRQQMLDLVAVQEELRATVRASKLRADTAHLLVDFAVANPSFTVRMVENALGLSYGRANKLIGQLEALGILGCIDPDAYKRRFFAPRVLEVLAR